MTDPVFTPPRFRFSLLTIIVTVNVAGVLIWANVRKVKSKDGATVVASPTSFLDYTLHTQGWPSAAIETQDPYGRIDPVGGRASNVDNRLVWHTRGIFINVLTAIGCLAGVAIATELLVRKLRKAKRHDE